MHAPRKPHMEIVTLLEKCNLAIEISDRKIPVAVSNRISDHKVSVSISD